MAGFRTITIPSAAGRRRRPRRVPGGARAADGGRDDHQPLDARPVRGADRRAARRGPRGGRPGLHGRREPERDPRPVQAGRGRLRRHALQRPQDVLDAARRRRPGRRPGRGGGDAPARSCPRRASCASDDGTFRLERPGERPTSIGRLRSFVGNTGVLVRAYAYIRAHGGTGPARGQRRRGPRRQLPASTGSAGTYDIPYDRACKHEFVASAATIKKRTGVRTLDIAKRLIDYGFHPPTIYFPLIVEEGMLIEPTETESVETLDAFADALIAIAAEAERRPGARHERPAHAPRPPARRGDGGPPAEPALAADDRRRDAVPGLKPTLVRRSHTERSLGCEVDSPRGAVDSTGSAPTRIRAAASARPSDRIEREARSGP